MPQRESIFYTRNYLEQDLQCIYSATGNSSSTDYHDEPMDVRFSSSGRMIGFTSGGNLYCIILDDNDVKSKPIQLTFNEDDGVSYGTPDFLSMEEMSRYEGYWFTDCDGIVFTKVDERAVDKYRIYYDVNDLKNGSTAAERSRVNHASAAADYDYDDDVMMSSGSNNCTNGGGGGNDHSSSADDAATTTTEYEEHRYPFAGQANPVTEVGYLPLSSLLMSMEALPNNIGSSSSSSSAEEVWAVRQERAKMLWREAIQWHVSPGTYIFVHTSWAGCNNI